MPLSPLGSSRCTASAFRQHSSTYLPAGRTDGGRSAAAHLWRAPVRGRSIGSHRRRAGGVMAGIRAAWLCPRFGRVPLPLPGRAPSSCCLLACRGRAGEAATVHAARADTAHTTPLHQGRRESTEHMPPPPPAGVPDPARLEPEANSHRSSAAAAASISLSWHRAPSKPPTEPPSPGPNHARCRCARAPGRPGARVAFVPSGRRLPRHPLAARGWSCLE
jgi:hypothetical protein